MWMRFSSLWLRSEQSSPNSFLLSWTKSWSPKLEGKCFPFTSFPSSSSTYSIETIIIWGSWLGYPASNISRLPYTPIGDPFLPFLPSTHSFFIRLSYVS